MREIPLTKGKVAIVDDRDYAFLSRFQWSAFSTSRNWYAKRRSDGALMHRVILKSGPNDFGDHRNGDGLDNRRRNLRKATRTQNNQYKMRKTPGCTSKHKGVSWDREKQKWFACIGDGPPRGHGKMPNAAKTRFLGRFESEKEAADAYDRAARESFGEFAATGVSL